MANAVDNIARWEEEYRRHLEEKRDPTVLKPRKEPVPDQCGITTSQELWVLNALKTRVRKEMGCQ